MKAKLIPGRNMDNLDLSFIVAEEDKVTDFWLFSSKMSNDFLDFTLVLYVIYIIMNPNI